MTRSVLISLCHCALLFVFTQCNNKEVNPYNEPGGATAGITDTVYIHDTVVVSDSNIPSQKAVLLLADKMNALYIGVENPITIQAVGVELEDISLQGSGDGLKLRQVSSSRYIATATRQGVALISVTGSVNANFNYRVKKIPDPQARLSNSTGGVMGGGEFKSQGGMMAILEDFDFDVACQIVGFELIYIPRHREPLSSQNVGARFTVKSRSLVNQAKPGDIYVFYDVRTLCPGDAVSRKINSMAFTIE